MPRVVHHPHGVVVDGKLYRRDQFATAEPRLKDWLLWLMIMIGLVVSGVLAVASLVALVWTIVEGVRRLL